MIRMVFRTHVPTVSQTSPSVVPVTTPEIFFRKLNYRTWDCLADLPAAFGSWLSQFFAIHSGPVGFGQPYNTIPLPLTLITLRITLTGTLHVQSQEGFLCIPYTVSTVWGRYWEMGHCVRRAGQDCRRPAARLTVYALLCQEEHSQSHTKMAPRGLLIYVFLTELSEADSMRVERGAQHPQSNTGSLIGISLRTP